MTWSLLRPYLRQDIRREILEDGGNPLRLGLPLQAPSVQISTFGKGDVPDPF